MNGHTRWIVGSLHCGLVFIAACSVATAEDREQLPAGSQLAAIEVSPESIELKHAFDYTQILLTGVMQDGSRLDVTRIVDRHIAEGLVEVTPGGLVRPKANGSGELRFTLAGQDVTLPLTITGLDQPYPVSFVRDVMPVLSKLGCNAGTCHGSKEGKNGFKLSLRGYDALYDHLALTDELSARRTDRASPTTSLMLLKATGSVPHVGGQVVPPDDRSYQILHDWIAAGVKLDLETPRVDRIEILPQDPIVPLEGMKQQVRIVAHYADGASRDVTSEAFVESGNMDIATADAAGRLTALRRGEAPVLARYEGRYAATRMTVMGDRSGFVWHDAPVHNVIDELVDQKLQRVRTLPSGLATDAEFLRRVYLDLTGLPPSADQVRSFLADSRDQRIKRDELIDGLVGDPEFVDHWSNKWADLLQVNRKFLGQDGAMAFRNWIRQAIASNMPYDEFAYSILTARGSNRENPPAGYFKTLRLPTDTMENTTHLFLAVRFNCNKCHDHPFERWTQDQYYNMAAFFAQVGLKRDPAAGDRTIAGTAVESAKPLYEVVFDKRSGEVTHDRTGETTAPAFPYEHDYATRDDASRRENLARWITSKNNRYFARSYVNRLWGYLTGVGLIEPIDDIRASNPASNPELLDWLTHQFVESRFDVQQTIRTICKSRTYQISIQTNEWNADDTVNYSHAQARRLSAEVLYDAVHQATGSVSKLPGVPAGFRAAQLPDVGIKLPSGFLDQFGRPARQSACECERTSELMLGPVMALINGPTIADAIADPDNAITRLVASDLDDAQLVKELYVRIVNRVPTPEETQSGVAALHWADDQPQDQKPANTRLLGAQDLAWALINTPAFLFNR